MPSAKPLRVLIIEDSEDDALLIARILQKGGYRPQMHRVSTRKAIEAALSDQSWDIVISDHNLPGLSSETVLEIVQEKEIDVPFIIVSGSIGEDIAVEAMKTGAHDYIMKDNLARLVPAIERELREVQTRVAHRRAEAVIHHLAYHDTLTGLTNRHEFESRLSRALMTARDDNISHVLLYIDLDQFKIINDTCGHVAGDELLRQLAVVLREQIRENDTLARLGGDEFGVLLEGCHLQQATRIGEELLDAIKSFRFSWQGKSFAIGASIGVVPFTGDQFEDMNAILSIADMACYAAKDMGRNRIHIYSDEDSQMIRRAGEMQWVARLTMAIEESRFTLYRQSIRPLRDSEDGDYFELLVRMVDEGGDLVLPGAFIPAAERYNLMHKIDRWVVENGFVYLGELNQSHVAFINLSGASFSDDSFFEFVLDAAGRHGVNPRQVCFEITETAAITNLSAAVSFIRDVKDHGFQFALDDFGAGLSSFSYLKTIPADYLKIDGSFIRDMIDDPMDRAIVESINRIGHVAGLKTVAEFVETDAILQRVDELGLDFAQGFCIEHPRPCRTEAVPRAGAQRKPASKQPR